MAHESDGTRIQVKIGLKVRCLHCPNGTEYYIDLNKKNFTCPKCGHQRYEIKEEVYEGG